MSTASPAVSAATPTKPWMIWTGRVLSAIPVLLFVVGGSFSFKPSPQMLEGMGKFGWQESSLPLIATLEICCAVLYIIPRTAVLGAILMTAYLGGAVATHLRVGDPMYPFAILMAIFVWGGLYGRDARIRELIPLTRAR